MSDFIKKDSKELTRLPATFAADLKRAIEDGAREGKAEAAAEAAARAAHAAALQDYKQKKLVENWTTPQMSLWNRYYAFLEANPKKKKLAEAAWERRRAAAAARELEIEAAAAARRLSTEAYETEREQVMRRLKATTRAVKAMEGLEPAEKERIAEGKTRNKKRRTKKFKRCKRKCSKSKKRNCIKKCLSKRTKRRR